MHRGFDLAQVSALRAEGKVYLPLDALLEPFAISCYTDEETGLRYYTPDAARFEIPEIRDVPVLMYHAVSDDLWGIEELFVSPKSMEAQLQYLVQNGYQPIWFEDLRHIEQYDKPVILTFDDGYLDNYTELFPLLQKYGVKATVFVIAWNIGGTHKMNEAQIREMVASGLVSIQCHTYSHGLLGQMDRKTLEFEYSESKKILTRLLGKEPSILCYPSGSYSDLSIEVARAYFSFGIKMQGGMYRTDADPFLVSRYYVSRQTSLQSFVSYLGS